ncbi:phosphoenolpyruvate carboxykinase-domain-containing protein [Aspergillus granulosus]|uniref:Phosphoenolpyruvate carboxykinase (ATP) n=1 Tax=Aspergillus granulosus TaxID=176169 RepID=A0ABR4I2Q9_9EURO
MVSANGQRELSFSAARLQPCRSHKGNLFAQLLLHYPQLRHFSGLFSDTRYLCDKPLIPTSCFSPFLLVQRLALPGTTSCPHLGFGSTRIAVRVICRLVSASAPTSPVKLWRSLTEKGTETSVGAYTAGIMGRGSNIHIPPDGPPSPGPLYTDFFEQQVAKQRNNNYHSTSLRNMVATSVNRTALHPGGVQPGKGHTELEEELHEHAHIDYERVAIIANPSVAALYEDALVYETGTAITSSGALTAYSGAKTGRSPLDKRVVKEESSENEIWWGPVNKPMTPEVWRINRERAVDYLNTRNRIYVIDGFAGWDERYRISVRVVCARAYHALFMRNMLIRPSAEELQHFHPDYVIYNAGSFPANRFTEGMTSATSVAINFAEKEMVILGTEYAGEMKKGVFTILFYEMPVKHNVLTLHSSANEGQNGDVTVFFGLSGTGKTTLSADPKRALIGDDEHCWTDRGVFNIEGGCYAKCIGLSAEKEPDIFNAIRFGSVLENVVFDPISRVVNYDDSTLTENTRCAYPIEYIENAKIPCLSDNHPTNIILLTCDARGVLPPISKLTTEQTMFHFISGYTSKMAGTEDGVTEPQATFSSCFAQPFLALHPMRYARMLADKISQHKANAWLLNTGWVGAGATTGGKRCPLKYTRAILDAIHSGELAQAQYETYEVFNLHVPTSCPGVPDELLNPKNSWTATTSFSDEVNKLAKLFNENFQKYADQATKEVIEAGPVISQ